MCFHVGHWLVKDEHAIDGRWRTERRNRIGIEHFERLDRIKLAARILREHSRALTPRTEQIAPRELCPPCLRKVPYKVILMHIEPVFARDNMPDRITCLGVEDHLGIANGAGGEIDQARIIAAGFGSCELWRSFAHDLSIVCPPFASTCIVIGLVREDGVLDGRTVGTHLVKLCRAFMVGNDSDGLSNLSTELNVFGGKERGARNGNYTKTY